MVQKTRRRLATLFSMVAGLWLTFSGGAARAYTFFSPYQNAVAKKSTSTRTSNVQGQTAFPNTVSAGQNMSPAPNTVVNGQNMSPAPDANLTTNTVMTVEAIEDVGAREYVSQIAVSQGLDANNLPRDFVNTKTIEYLIKEVDALKAQLQR